jgi:hypothetical protein
MPSASTTLRAAASRTYRRILPWALALAVATCSDDQNGPTRGGVGYFAFKPVYGISNSLSQFGVVADSVHVLLTRPINQVVLDTTVFFSPDSTQLHLALPILLETSPESLTAVIEIKSGGTILFVDSLDVQVSDGPPNPADIPTVTLTYVGPGQNVAAITLAPGDTTIVLGDTLFFTATAVDSSAAAVTSFYTAWKTSDTTVARINAQGRLIAPNLRGSVKVIGYTPTGIEDTTLVTFAPVPTQILADSGTAQSGLVGDSLATLFVGKVIGGDNLGISGIAVRFTAVTATGAIRDTLLITDVNGRVRTRGVLGTVAGAYSFSATVVGTAITTTFGASAGAGAPSGIAIQSGNAQVDSAGRGLPLPFTVRVTDAYTNPVSGVKIYWLRTVGTGTLALDSSLTNAGGLATTGYTLGAVGVDSVTATIAGTGASIAFRATAINGLPATVAKTFGDAQTDTVGRLLTDSMIVIVRSATAQPVVGVPVVWTVLRGGATSDDTVFTDVTGRAAVTYTAGTVAGTDSVRAQAGVIAATFTTNALTGSASILTLVSGSGQIDTIGKALPLPFVVHAADAFGNAVPGTFVQWAVAAGTGTLTADSSLTDGSGNASTNYILGPTPGADTIAATLSCGCTTVPFFVTGLTAAPAAIQIFFGNAQTAEVATTLPDSLVATVLDGASNPIVSAQVIWTVLRGGTVAVDTVYSDALGHAAVQYTTGTLVGIDSIRAQALVGGASNIFTTTVTAGAPISLGMVSGDGQSDTIGTALALPFVVQVQDAYNNPVAGTPVTFARIAGSGTLTVDSVITDVNGLASAGYTLGLIPGVDTVRATLEATGGIFDFNATALPAAPASIVTIQGDSQTITPNTTADTFAVRVRDAANNPVIGQKVDWSFIPAVGNFTPILSAGGLSSFTDSLGVARGIYTSNVAALTLRVEASIGSQLIDSLYVFIVPGAPSLIATQSGVFQTDTAGHPLPLPFVVRVTDASNNPTPGAKVYWTRVAGGGQVSADSTFTDGAGITSVNYVLGASPSADTVIATIAGTSTFATFDATGVSASPASIQTFAGDLQGDSAGKTIAPLVAIVRDGASNPIVGTPVIWTVIRGGSLSTDTVITNGSGLAQVSYTLGTTAGIDSVRAQAGSASVIFTAAVSNGAGSTIAIQSGNNQTDTLGHAIALPFVVRVTDAFGNPVSGDTVAFTRIAGSGTLFADTLVTDASGLASVGYLFGLVPAVDTIRADLVGTGANVNFIATAVVGVAATLNAVSGDAQTDTALATVAAPMVLQVLDAQGRQVPGAIVSFAGTGGVTPSQAVDTADLNGNVSVGITLGDTVGVWSVTATVVAVPAVQAVYTFTTTPGSAALMAIVSGDGQTDTLGKTLALPFVVHVTDASGNDVAGGRVSFTVTAGGGTLAGDTVLTNAAGQASIGYTLGGTPGTNTVHADLVGAGAKLDFNAFAVNAFPASIAVVSGNGQSAAVTTGFADSLVALVLDANDNPIVNGAVVWTVSGGGLTFSADTTFTDSLGNTNVRVTAGTVAGAVVIHAQALGLGSLANFPLTVTAGAPASMTYVSGNAQTDTVGRTLAAPFVVNVVDAYGNPVSGAPVTFVRTVGSGTVLGDTVNTDLTGDAAVNYQLGTFPGIDSVDANLASVGTTITFTATTVGALPASIVATQGNGQTGTVGVTLPTALVADVKDGSNNPIIGAGVVWTVVRGGSLDVDTTFTDGTGQVAADYTMGTAVGTDSVQATTLTGGFIATFSFTATADVASLIAVQSGDGQVDTTGRTLPLPFTVYVSDAYNNPVAGQTVLFTLITASGTFSADSVVTDAAGLASTNYTLGNTPGLEDVRATLKGTSAFIDFFATTVSGAPALIAKILGDVQTDTVLSTLTDSLVVELRDAASTPIPSTWIYWQTAGATVSADSTLTGADGRAAVSVTFGNVAIPIIVLARNVDTTLAAVFTLHATAGAPTQITTVAGNGQTGAINDTLPIDFSVLLQDAYNNPAQAGVAVTWTNLVGFLPGGLPDTTITDTLGVATLIKPLLSSFVGADSLVAQIQGRPDSVIFTATTNAGPAASLIYVSGTGQTDTVGRSLSAPMVVQLRDAGSNPVVGAWVQWKLISGSAAVPLDSTQTDAAGAASSSLTMGTIVGLDSISATFAGVTDTVVFYALAENDTAAALAIISGDGQSANIGNPVPLSVVAEVQDQYGNGVDGVTVTFTPSGLASSVANPSVVTDASGQANSGTWTLDSLAGTNTLLAAAGALNKTAGAFSLPIGTSKYWNGLTSTDWNDPSNWSPAGVPVASDNVFIPVSQPAPVLSADGVTNDLTLQGGGTLDYGSNTLTINGSLFGGGANIFGPGAVVLAGSGTLDQLNVAVVHLTGSYALTSGAVAQVGYLQIDATGTLDLNGHALVVNGNMSQGGQLVMKAGSDSLDVLGNFDASSFQTGAGNLTNGTMVLRGGLTQSGATGSFQPTANHTTLFVGAGQNVDFLYPDSTNDGSGSYFNIVHFTDSTNFTTSVAFRGAVTVDTGKKVTSTGGTTAGLNAALIGDVYADWSFNNTRFWATPATVPDSLRGSLEFFNSAVTLTKPLAVGGALRVSDNSNLTLNGNWVRVDSAFHSSGTGQVTMTSAADSLDIAGTATIDGGTGSFQDGVLVLRGDLSVPGASAVFQATGTHRTRFAGTTTQQVAFASPSLATNRFNTVEFDNAAGVNFNSDGAVQTLAEVKLGQVTGAGTISLSGDLVDTTNSAWRPEFTVMVANTGLLPTHFTRNLELRDTTTLTGAFTVGSSLTLSGTAFLDVNGQTLTVDSNLVLFGGAALLQMTNAADSVDVGFSTAFNGGDETGHLTAGVLALRGDLTANQGTPTFAASGTHRTRLLGAATTISFPFSTGYAGNHFQDLELPSGGSVINAFTDLYVAGTLTKPSGSTGTVQAPSQVQLQAHGLQVDDLNFDNVRVVYSGSTALQFDNVNFLTEDANVAQLQLDLNGGTVTLNNTHFQVAPTSGYYVAVTDTEVNESSVQVNMYRSQPLDGTVHEFEVGGNDGTTILWSKMVFATQPIDAAVGDTLQPFRVAVLNPVGDTATWYTGAVDVAVGANLFGGQIGGTTQVTAVAGIATFSDISIDSAGFGYTLNARDLTGGIGPVSSLPFNLTVPAPVGFDAVWYGSSSNDWTVAANWSTGIVPDSTTNVFIAAGTLNTATILADSVFVKRIRIAPTATVNITSGTKLIADSSFEGGPALANAGTLVLRGTGDITGDLGGTAWVTGTYAVKGTAAAADLEIFGALTVANDTLNVSSLLQPQGAAQFVMNDPAALVNASTASFATYIPGTGMTDGTLRITGSLSAYGGTSDPFTPSGNHVTEFVGTGVMNVDFYIPDSATGSHFANVRVNGTGTVNLQDHFDIMGTLDVVQGTLAGDPGMGVTVHQGITLASGTTLALHDVISGGAITVAGGATYSAPLTTYYGAGAPLAISALPYDTLQIHRAVVASEDLTIPGDLRINSFGADAGRFDLGGHTVAVSGSVNINGNGALIEQNAADALNVTGDFFTNGASTIGLLTAGTLQIGGNFRQAGDFSGGAFRASPAHTTRFTGGPGIHVIKFDSPAGYPGDSGNSKFGALDLADGIDSLAQNGLLADAVTIGGSVVNDIAFGSRLQATDSVRVLATSPILQVQDLLLGNGISFLGATTYDVVNTTFLGGTTLPVLAYQNVSISGPSLTMTADVTATGSFGIGQNGEVGGSPGDLIVNGHKLTVGSSFATGGYGVLTMTAAADTVDVGSDIEFNGGNTAGHLTAGTLIGHGVFSADQHSGDSSFVAGPAHRVILMAPGASTLYVNTASEAGMQFGKLYLLDGAQRTISTPSNRLIVQDSLVLGTAAGGITGGVVLAQGPVFTVSGSTLESPLLYVDSTLEVHGSYSATTTQFGGQNQAIPGLPYVNVNVTGTAFLTDSMVLSLGATLAMLDGDLRVNGRMLRAGQIIINGTGTLTMTNAADTVDAGSFIHFFGGNESGKLTDGVLLVHGAFSQFNGGGASDSSFFASGNHETRFTDSTTAVNAIVSSMFAGASRFNNVAITGKGVNFTGQVWVGGNIGIVSPTVDPVTGGTVTIAGSLSDAGPTAYLWNVDTTLFLSRNTVLPDSMNKLVILAGGDTLHDIFRVGGELVIQDTVVVNGFTVLAHNNLTVSGPGVLQMTNSTDEVVIDGIATFNGAPSTGYMTAGRLTLHGDFVSGMVTPGVFEATGSHVTVFNGGSGQSIVFGSGFPRGAFNDVVTYNSDLTMAFGLVANGTFRDSVAGLLTLNGNNNELNAVRVEMTDVQVNDLPIAMGENSQFDNATFTFTDPTTVTQILVMGAGSATPLDLHGITFNSWAGAPQLVHVVDTTSNGLGIKVRMFGATPFDGSTETVINQISDPGLSSVAWSHLVLGSGLPATLDSMVPFTVSMYVQGPDTSYENSVNGTVDVSLVNNTSGASLVGATSASFDGSSANFFLQVDKAQAGLALHFEIQGRSIDSVNSTPVDVINPAPVGSIAWDGEAGDGLWTSGTNWVGDAVPTEVDSVFIPGNVSVTFDSPNDTVGTLVLGSGANLTIQPGDSLFTFGRVSAGNTISGSGTFVLAGAIQEISGTFPNTTIIGTATAVGPVNINGDLAISGVGADFNIGGQKVAVSNTLFTQSGGLLTMDGDADTVYAASASFAGGDEEGHLSAGVLLIQGSNFDQGFGDPKSFYATGTHTVIFGNGGSATAVNISEPHSSQFRHVKIQNPNGVDFNESGLGYVTLSGDVTLSAFGVASGDTLKIDGTLTVGSSESITANELDLGLAPSVSGGYSVGNTVYFGAPVAIPAVPGGYQTLTIATDASLAGPVDAATVLATSGDFAPNGQTLHTQFFTTLGSGRLVMTNPLDTLIVDQNATFGGQTEGGMLTDGAVILAGNLDARTGKYLAGGNHLTRFVGTSDTVYTSPFIICEGPCFPQNGVWAGRLEAENANVVVSEPTGGGLHSAGSALLTNSTIGDGTGSLFVQGDLTVDATSTIHTSALSLGQRIFLASGATFDVNATYYVGPNSHIMAAPYQELFVIGGAVLDTAVTAHNVTLQGTGVLTMAGHALTVDTDFVARDQSHLVMSDANDSLLVAGDAVFKADSTEGDFTDGAIMARNLLVPTSTSGGHVGFVQTGANRYIPMANDTIEIWWPGPAESRLKSIDFSSAAGPVTVQGLWVTDTAWVMNAATVVNADTGYQFFVKDHFIQTDGAFNVPRFAIGGTLAYSAGSYVVDTTVFADFGGGQTVPANVPYANIVVQYAAMLSGGSLDLRTGGHSVRVENVGQLDLGGYTLQATDFRTTGGGQLKMTDPADTLIAYSVTFDGDTTVGLLTAGVIRTPQLVQAATTSAKSYAPSGTHRLVLDDLGLDLSDVSASFQTPDSATGSYANILVMNAYQVGMYSNVVTTDSLLIDNQINDEGGHTITAYGPVVMGSGANVTLDSLIVHDTLVVDPSATYSVNNTVFAPGAGPIPAAVPYTNVFVEGDQTLTAPLTLGGELYVLGSGTLTPAGQKVLGTGGFHLQDNARLVMASGDTLDMGSANFAGAASGADLAGGILRIRNGLYSGGATSQSFAPTGMVTEFYGGGLAVISLAVVSPSNSYIDTMRVIEGTFVAPSGDFLAMAPAVLKDGSIFDGNSSNSALDFRKGLSVLDSSKVEDAGSSTIFFEDSLTVATPGYYSVANTRFGGTKGIPDLLYQGLIIDSVQMTLTHPITASSQLIITGGSPGATKITLGGFAVTAGTLDISGYATVEMNNPNDSLVSIGNMGFAGEDETGLLNAGHIRVGGDLNQNGFFSPKSLAVVGATVELYGGGTHLVTFASPSNTQSYLGRLSIVDGGTADVRSSVVITQGLDMDASSSFRMTTNPSLTADIFGAVNFGTGTTFTTEQPGDKVNFYGTVNPGAGMSYSVETTSYTNTKSLADVPYTNLFLADGTFDTLSTTLNVTGELGLSTSGPGGQDLVLNGHTINAGRLTTSFFGRFTMNNPADQLNVTGSAIFDGGDLSGRLTQGTISIGDSLTQFASWSDKSFRSTGTTVQFPFGPAHEITFATADSSYFADVSAPPSDLLSIHINGRMKATGTVGNYSTVVAGDSLEVGVLAAGPGNGVAILDYLKAGQINGAFSPFTVGVTELAGSGVLPLLGYDSLIVSGDYTIPSFGGSLLGPLTIVSGGSLTGGNNTATLAVTSDVVVNGGLLDLNGDTVSAGGNFATLNGGLLQSTAPGSALSVAGDVTFNGGAETTHLTRGSLTALGDFTTGVGFRYDADSLFTLNFTGGGNHVVFLANPAQQRLGTLALTATSFRSDTLTLPSTTYTAYKLQATGNGVLTSLAAILQVEGLNVNGLIDSGVAIDQYTLNDQPLAFNEVTFRGFGSTDMQLRLTDNGGAVPFTFVNIDFDDAAVPDGSSGFFLFLTDNDGPSPDSFNLIILGPDYLTGAALSSVLGGGSVNWFPPS